jgi:hypothetical protein
VNSLNLSKTFCDKSSFVDGYITVRVSLFLKDPFILNGLAVAENIYQGQYLVVILMSTHASVLVDSVGPPSAEVCRTAASFP